jgi:hypothetical protein
MRISSKLLSVVLLVCCGATSPALLAQAPAPPAPTPSAQLPSAKQPASLPPTVKQGAIKQVNGTVVIQDNTDPGAPPARPRPFLNSHGLCCVASFHDSGCRNLGAQIAFCFGSCRTFFGQTCMPDAAHFGPDSHHGQAANSQAAEGSGRCCGK